MRLAGVIHSTNKAFERYFRVQTKLTPGTIRNMVSHGQFKVGIHYVKAGPRKLLFLWSGIADWLHEGAICKISVSRK
jgi:hypothetical protein